MTLIEDKNIFDLIVDGISLSRANLASEKVACEEIAELLVSGALLETETGYVLKSTKELFHYGKHLIAIGDRERAEKCFEICYKIDPTHPAVNFQMFLKYIRLNDFEGALKFLDRLLDVEIEFYKRDTKLYEYLLSFLTDMDKERVRKIEDYRFDELTVLNNDKRYDDIVIQNKIIQYIYNGYFSRALSLMKQSVESKGHITAREIVIRSLAKQVRQVKRSEQRKLYDLIIDRDFEKAKIYLIDKGQQHPLSKLDRYVLIILEKIEDLDKKRADISLKPIKSNNIFEAIDNGNYPLALSLLRLDKERYNEIFRILLYEVNRKTIKYGGNEMKRIAEILKYVEMYGVVVVEVPNPQDEEYICETVYSFCNMDTFPVEYDGHRYLVFKNDITPETDIPQDLSKAISDSLEAQDFDMALELAKMQVEKPFDKKYEDYLTLGEIHYRVGDIKIAKECYIASYGLCTDKTEKERIDQKIKSLSLNTIDRSQARTVYADTMETVLGSEDEEQSFAI